MSQEAQTRWLVTLFAAVATAVAFAAPAGAWVMDESTGGPVQSRDVTVAAPQRAESTPLQSNLVHEGVQADRRAGAVVAAPVVRDDIVADKATPKPDVVPYLSHGVGVPDSFGGTTVEPPVPVEPTVVSDDSAFDIGNLAIGLTAAVGAALLLAMAAFALLHGRPRRPVAL